MSRQGPLQAFRLVIVMLAMCCITSCAVTCGYECAGANDLKPCLSASTEVTISSHATADDSLQHCLAVSRLAVATALMELPPDIRSIRSKLEGGLLLGAKGFQVTLTLPSMLGLQGTPEVFP